MMRFVAVAHAAVQRAARASKSVLAIVGGAAVAPTRAVATDVHYGASDVPAPMRPVRAQAPAALRDALRCGGITALRRDAASDAAGSSLVAPSSAIARARQACSVRAAQRHMSTFCSLDKKENPPPPSAAAAAPLATGAGSGAVGEETPPAAAAAAAAPSAAGAGGGAVGNKETPPPAAAPSTTATGSGAVDKETPPAAAVAHAATGAGSGAVGNKETPPPAAAPSATDVVSGAMNKAEKPASHRPDEPWYKQPWAANIFYAIASALVLLTTLLVALFTSKHAIDVAKVPSEASEKQDRELAAVAAGVEVRLLDGIKARILQPERPPAFQLPQAGEAFVRRRILPLERAAASDLFKELEQEYPIDIVIAPKGYGKSTAARVFARDPANPHVIYVDLHGCKSFDAAAKRVANAIGYRTVYTEEEKRAKKGGFGVDDLDKPWGADEYDYVLRLFMRASGELLAAGELKGGRSPMLLLDHASRPFGDSKRITVPLDAPPSAYVASSDPSSRLYDTLIFQTLESTKTSDLAANRQCRFVFITSDTTAERDSWEKSGARDTFNYRVLPAFTTEEATELLAHHQYFNLFPTASADQHPPADEVARIRRTYASTFAFLIAALGTRARVLALSIDSLHGKQLVPDAELATKGVPIPDALLSLLSATLPATVIAALATSASPASKENAPSLRVDGIALFKVYAWIWGQQKIVEGMFKLPPDIVLPPAPQPTEDGQRIVRRVLNVDAGLRALRDAGTMAEVDFERVFGSSMHLAPVLAERHLVFYNLETKKVEFESEAVKQVVLGVLKSEPHKARLELARTLLEWQTATAALATAKDSKASAEGALASATKQWELEFTPPGGWFGLKERKPSAEAEARKAETNKKCDAATKRRDEAEATVAAKLARIEELRKLVPAPGSA